MSTIIQSGRGLLAKAEQELVRYNVSAGMEELIRGLKELRSTLPRDDWQAFAEEECSSHSLLRLLHQSPFTRRSFERPRGYPGDAHGHHGRGSTHDAGRGSTHGAG